MTWGVRTSPATLSGELGSEAVWSSAGRSQRG